MFKLSKSPSARTIALTIGLLCAISGIGLQLHALGSNLVPNASVETAASTTALPTNWQKDKWGSNTSTLSTKADGHTGLKSLYVNVTKYTNGDAKWYFDAVSVKPSTSYTFSDYSKSNVATSIVAMYTSATGVVSYTTLVNSVPSQATWTPKSIAFTTPSNVKTMTVFHLINKVGWLQTDDFNLAETTAVPPASAPTVSLTTPVNGSNVSGTIALAASATGAAGVQFKVDGVNVGAEDTSSPYAYSWDSKTVANGAHTVSAVARNATGTTTALSSVTVTNVVPSPTVSITTPVPNQSLSGQTALTATAANAAGVQFKVDGVNVGAEDTSSPYIYVWDTTTTTNGSHVITAIARNTTGQTASSTTVTANVYNAPAPVVINLVTNPSVETNDPANPQLPASWSHNAWGSNTAIFTYEAAGHTGSKALRTQITNYTDGDAKWYFAAVPASASTQYQFNDWYQSNTQTSIVVELQNAAGTLSYMDLGTVAPSTTWAQSNVIFTTKTDTTAFTVYHLLNSVGSLTTDDTAVTKVDATTTSNPIANSSLETSNGVAPTDWTHGGYGTNTVTTTYVPDGHSGTKSVRTTLTNYVDGDAKWYYNPISSLEKGKQYRWTTWYKTNIRPQAVMMFTRANGTEGFIGMPQPFPAIDSTTVWQQYSETFIVPQDAVSVTNFLFIAGNGWVQVDDQSLTTYQPTGWNRALVTLTFDDGHEENVANALPVLNQYGIKSTQCYNTTDLKLMADGGKATLDAFTSTGHEICSHTSTHPFLTSLTSGQLADELGTSKTYLEQVSGNPVQTFASPYGDYNEAVNTEIKKYYISHRTVDEGYNSKDNFDAYRLRVQNMTPATTLAQYQSWLDQAKATNTWLVLVYHDIVSANPTPYGSYTADFKAQMQALNASGLTVKTYVDALTEVKAQL